MADFLYDRLTSKPPLATGLGPGPGPGASGSSQATTGAPNGLILSKPHAIAYLNHLASLPLSALDSSEPAQLSQTSHTLLLSLQTLSKKSHAATIASADRHAGLRASLPRLAASTRDLCAGIPRLDAEVERFSTAFSKTGAAAAAAASSANAGEDGAAGGGGDRTAVVAAAADILARRKRALLLARNVERLVDVLELPTLLSGAMAAGSGGGGTGAAASTASGGAVSAAGGGASNYSSALDLNAHIRRLRSLHPSSPLVASVARQSDEVMAGLAAALVGTLRGQGLKLAAALRTVGWLRRVLPDLETAGRTSSSSLAGPGPGLSGLGGGSTAGMGVAHERNLGAIFLTCRMATFVKMLEALEPLRELAEQERARRKASPAASTVGGQQTERYLKQYLEIFREQSFAIVSMFKSIFPAAPAGAATSAPGQAARQPGGPTSASSRPSAAAGTPADDDEELLQPAASPLSSFVLCLVEMLADTLRTYLPSVRDQASRDSLLTQVLYCAGSLGRLGGDFGVLLAEELDADDEDSGGGVSSPFGATKKGEWADVVRRHRVLAGKLESMGGEKKGAAGA